MSKYILLLFCIVQINIYCQSIYKTARDIYRTYRGFEQLSQMVTDLYSIITKHDISKPPINYHSNLSIAKYSSLLPPTFNLSASKDLWEVLHGAEPNKKISSNLRNADGALQANKLLLYQEGLTKIIDRLNLDELANEPLSVFSIGDVEPFAAADGLVTGIYPMDAKIAGESGSDRSGITFGFDKINKVYTPNNIFTRPFLLSTYSPIHNKKVSQNQFLLINPWNDIDVFCPLKKWMIH